MTSTHNFHSHSVTRRAWLLAAVLLCSPLAFSETLRVNQTDHPLDSYAVGALKVAMEYMEGDYSVSISEDPITQTRAIERLESDRMDVMWLSSNQEAEERLIPVRFPMLKGLLGHRIFIINADNQARFDRVREFSDLKQLTFGQGAGWPDVTILEDNGLDVITTSKYDNLFYMVEGGRFDAFPRGVLEPWTELKAHPDLPLRVEDNLVLVYVLPFYFFVSPDRPELAEAIKTGLDRALASGRFDEYFYGHPMVEDALTRSNLKNRRAFELDNPFLSPETPLDNDNYWLNLDDL